MPIPMSIPKLAITRWCGIRDESSRHRMLESYGGSMLRRHDAEVTKLRHGNDYTMMKGSSLLLVRLVLGLLVCPDDCLALVLALQHAEQCFSAVVICRRFSQKYEGGAGGSANAMATATVDSEQETASSNSHSQVLQPNSDVLFVKHLSLLEHLWDRVPELLLDGRVSVEPEEAFETERAAHGVAHVLDRVAFRVVFCEKMCRGEKKSAPGRSGKERNGLRWRRVELVGSGKEGHVPLIAPQSAIFAFLADLSRTASSVGPPT